MTSTPSPWLAPLASDRRSLALFRVALAVGYLLDLATRAVDLEAFYGDRGVLPRGALLDQFGNAWHVSALFATGRPELVALVFLVGAVAGLALLAGFYTRLATLVSWFVIISIQARNPMILQGGDVLLRLLLFWSFFLPVSSRASVDAWLAKRPAPPNPFISVASVALVVQVLCVYWFSVLQKSGSEWWPDGTAVYYALNLDMFATRPAIWLRQYPDLMRIGTYAAFFAEALLPLLLISPFRTTLCRIVGIVALTGMHANFGLFLDLGNFPWLDAVSFIPFIPSAAWDFFQARSAAVVARFQPQIDETLARLDASLLVHPRLFDTPTRPNQVFAGIFLVYILYWNATTIPRWGIDLPRSVAWIGNLLRLDQSWGMFAPYPMKDDGWYVIDGKLKDGTAVDVRHGTVGAPSYAKPEYVVAEYADQRWRKYYLNLWLASNKGHRLYFGRWLCRHWNAANAGASPLDTFTIVYMREDTLPDRIADPQRVDLWKHGCFK